MSMRSPDPNIMEFKFLKICTPCFFVTLSGTIVASVFFRKEVNSIRTCTVESISNAGIRADCGNGTKIYQAEKNIALTQTVCLQGIMLSNCNTFKLGLLVGMIAVGTTLSFLFFILTVYDLMWWYTVILNNNYSRTHPEPVQIYISAIRNNQHINQMTDEPVNHHPPNSPRQIQSSEIPLQEICVSERANIVVGTSSFKTVIVKNPEQINILTTQTV